LGEVNAVLAAIANATDEKEHIQDAGDLSSASKVAFQECLRIRIAVLGSSHPKALRAIKELKDLDD
jgi:hypothetical protein